MCPLMVIKYQHSAAFRLALSSYPLSAFMSSDLVQSCEHFIGPIETFLSGVRKIGGEGVVAKRLSSRYEPGRRSGAWSKMRINIGQEFVVGGFTSGTNGIDALVVGFYDKRKLVYAARVGSGLIPATRRDLYAKLKPLIIDACPLQIYPKKQKDDGAKG